MGLGRNGRKLQLDWSAETNNCEAVMLVSLSFCFCFFCFLSFLSDSSILLPLTNRTFRSAIYATWANERNAWPIFTKISLMLPYLVLYVIFSLVDTEIDGSSCTVCCCVDRQTEAGKDLENADIRYIVNPSTIRSQRQRKGYHGDCVFTSASLQIWHREPVSMVTVLIHLLPNQSANSSQCVCACVHLYVSDSLRWFLIPLPESVIASALASQH